MKTLYAAAMLAALVLPAAMPVALASHMTSYTNYPNEHDDLGASPEPDFFGVTSVFGQTLSERTIDLNLDGVGEATAGLPLGGRVLAPGCTDDSGRQPSGLCGLWTIGAGNGPDGTSGQNGVPANLVGVQGSSGPNAPGLTRLKSASVRFLDSRVNGYYALPLSGITYIELNRKLADSGVGAALKGVDPNLGGNTVLWETGHWVWYGLWRDKNGNGVVDHLQRGKDQTVNPPNPLEDPANEFQWYGNCLRFNGGVSTGWHCHDESADLGGTRITILTYVFPGSHHGDCGVFLLGANEALCDVPQDYPGKQAVCFAGIATGATTTAVPAVGATVAPGKCAGDLRTMDEFDERSGSDPLLGPQGSLVPDVTHDDRSGDPDWDTRAWTGALGLQNYYFDESVLVTSTMATGVNCKEDGSRRGLDLQSCRMLDVDVFPTWNPGIEAMLTGQVKPGARNQWTGTRDSWIPFQTTIDGVRNNRALYDQNGVGPGTGPTQGQANAVVVDPGLAREPNNDRDVYPGARRGAFGPPDFEGKNTDYSGHRAGERAYVDNRMVRAFTYSHAIGSTTPIPGQPTCQLCFAGPGVTSTASPEPIPGNFPRDDGQRSLGPGRYYFTGAMGRWHDKPQTWAEDVFDVGTLAVKNNRYTRGPDGWVGNVVNATATYYYRGYTDQECTQQGVTAVVPYGWCHPYLHGNLADPQQDGATAHGEWKGKCSDVGAASSQAILLYPKGGTWTVPVLVMEKGDFIDLPGYVTRGGVKDYTGQSRPIPVGIHCFDLEVTGLYLGTDLVLLPAGNLGLEVTAVLTAQVPTATGIETVVDADTFAPWGA